MRPRTVAPKTAADHMRLMSNTVLVGNSAVAPSTAHIPKALREADLWKRADRSTRIRHFRDIGLVELLLTQHGTDAVA